MCYVSGVVFYVPTNTEVATVSNSVDESGESVQAVTFNNTGIFQTTSYCEFVD